MGVNDWDDETVLRRDRPARSRREDDYGDAPTRSSTRGRDGASSSRGDPRDRYDRDQRSRSGGGRGDGWGDAAEPSSPRSSRASYSSSGAPSSGRRPRQGDDYDDPPRRSGRSVPARGDRDGYDDGSYNRRNGRDSRDPRYSRDPRADHPDRSGRGIPSPRSMPRGDTDGWNTPPRSRAGGMDGRDPRARRPADVGPARPMGGGLWGDGPISGRRRAVGGVGDPRSRAAGATDTAATSAKRSFSFGRVLGILALAFVLGIAVAFAYHVVTTPKIPTTSGQPTTTPATTTTPGGTTTPSGTTTPHTLIPNFSVTLLSVG